MTIRFRSAQRRAFWSAVAFSLIFEFIAIYLAYYFSTNRHPLSLSWALLTTLGIQLFLITYAIFSFFRRTIWYFVFEQNKRAEALAREFQRLNFPRPETYYDSAEAYLTDVALSPETSPESAHFASMLVGMLLAHNTNGPRVEAFFLNLSLEKAMKLMLPWEARAALT